MMMHVINAWGIAVFAWLLALGSFASMRNAPCDRSRHVFTSTWGVITDGPSGSNYTQDSHCEWLIRANKSQYITLSFRNMGTECSFDYVFVYEGDSFSAPLLGSFSGKTEPQQVISSSGSMLILLYSDTNYVLGGFQAEFSVSNCARNCSNHGNCIKSRSREGFHDICDCTSGWDGYDCSVQLCPDDCGSTEGRGMCVGNRCQCRNGYSGMACTLHADDAVGNRWHWLAHFGHGLKPRAAHTAVYVAETDSLYVFGGYDLNYILGDLSIYKFSSSRWEDENGNVLGVVGMDGSSGDPSLLLSSQNLMQINPLSFLGTILYPFSENASRFTPDNNPFRRSKSLETPAPVNLRMKNNSNQRSMESPLGPLPRYGHAAAQHPAGFVIYGGKLANGSLSDELWLYNVHSRRWSLRCQSCTLRPPPLTRHTITLVEGGGRNLTYLYLFGGSTSTGEFSSRLFRISLVLENSKFEEWEEVRPRGGKELDLRIVAHTTSYHKPTDSLLVYGGVMASQARLSRLSDRMFLFKIKSRLWSEVHYPRADLPDAYVPHERAFHTSSILGNYLVVFGGYSHRHNKEEICYDNQMYFYHLGCQTWVSHEIFGASENGTRYGKQQGVFAQAADVRGGNTLLVVGGYHGNVNADLWAYTLPPTLTARAGEPFDPEAVCPRHHSHAECASNPECGWCSVDSVCYSRTVGTSCTTNLQTRRCPGICPALGNCHSCLIHGDPPQETYSGTVAQKLKLGQCTWCVQNARCHHKNDNYGVCGVSEDVPSQTPGWWGVQGTEVTQVDECRIKDRRPGLTFIKYKHPANFSQPDFVSIINATTVDFDVTFKDPRLETGSGSLTARLVGFLRTPESWTNAKETLRMCNSYSTTVLQLSANNATELAVVGNISAEPSTCSMARWPSGDAVELEAGRYLVDVVAKGTHNIPYGIQSSRMMLMHNKSTENSRVFTFEYLEPYENGSCSEYSNCLHCLTDSLCGWCEMESQCVPRYSAEAQPCHSTDPEDWQYLTLQPFACTNCSNHISCDTCAGSQLCEWWAQEAKCVRRGRAVTAIQVVSECPAPCHARPTCATCLDDKDRCVWCEATQECFSFSVYTSQYQFGLCREWVDQSYQSHGQPFKVRGAEQCKNCSRHTNCSSCLHTLSCGWCFSEENPNLGACVAGNFNSPANGSCVNVMNSLFNNDFKEDRVDWSYGQCPDVDECELKVDDCHPNAMCTNTHGSFNCQCKRGFFGDGRHTCIKTCYNDCVHGICSMAPDYKCVCDVGWTGSACSIDCGCNKHSTCFESVGVCDSCQHWTTGVVCQFCKAGGYGNATDSIGCRACDCNGHGDEERGLCDQTTGACFCKHNTEGYSCQTCNHGYYGDARNGGICYVQCSARGMVGPESQGIGSGYGDMTPRQSRLEGQRVRECLWILQSSSNVTKSNDSIIQFQIAQSDISMKCEDNAVFVYNALPDVVLSSASHHSHALGTFCNIGGELPFVIESKTGVLTVMFKQGNDGEGFNATYSIFSCPDNCPPSRICKYGHCVCGNEWTGPNCTLPLCPNNCSYHLKQGVCDRSYGRCICAPEFGESDCSIRVRPNQLVITELFHSARLADSFEHLRKMIPRFGHSLVADRRGSLWMFGGFSPSHGPLNDIRLFDTKNNTWMQVTIDSTRDSSMPEGRYLHAAEIVHTRREIFVLGGITDKQGTVGLTNNTLRDFWKFSIASQGWIEIVSDSGPPSIAGHTLTLRKDQESENLVVIGGFSQRDGFINTIWNFNLTSEKWSVYSIKSNGPLDIYGHSTVYHEQSKSLYVFGGFSYTGGGHTKKLYALHYPTLTWSVLPPFEDFSSTPLPRFLHSAVATDNYMLVLGGHLSTRPKPSEFLFAYSFGCNQWVRLLDGDHIVGKPPPWTYGQDMTLDPESGAIYVVGGFTGPVQSHVTRINLPEDLCNLWIGKDKCRYHLGCSYCAVSRGDAALSSDCYSSALDLPDVCTKYQNGTLITNNGVICNATWLNNRPCTSYKTCEDCSVHWPLHWDDNPSCQWEHGFCQSYSGSSTDCSTLCYASDCNKCMGQDGCTWNDTGSCVASVTTSDKTCAVNCATLSDCSSCLKAPDCHWSVALQECISPVQQPLYCAGGACGLVIRSGQGARCPEPCGNSQQCSTCLRASHCGWCSFGEPLGGEGVCVAGTMHGPVSATCFINSTWHYVACPLEDECKNGHHTCEEISEMCLDLDVGFICSCAQGYAQVGNHCEPVCSRGCVRGSCVQPDNCVCDFGYVGTNCSIQCQCNGHSDCLGPDKLDKCERCLNNTEGPQCERCKPLFVGDATNNGTCTPCYDYCHGHTRECTPAVEKVDTLSDHVEHSMICRHCSSQTAGPRCETCKRGFYRGSDNLRFTCKPCECHGHGDDCDSVTGEKCNCVNNTESDCSAHIIHISKNLRPNCAQFQCAKCKETYAGTPTGGHMCYKQMSLEHHFCLDHKLQDECKLNPSPLYPGQTVFIMVQPRYVNVDIRIILDVTDGSLELRMSPKDDFLIMDYSKNASGQVAWDPKYNFRTGVEGVVPMDLTTRVANRTYNDRYWSREVESTDELTTYVTLKKKNTFLIVKNIRNRLILTLPKERHDLINTKFYIALTADHPTPSKGIIFFRQDQLHIDLFVFFSVFFSCFFLFLAACVVAWKAKQATELRRARRRHVVEMLHMAKRPFAGLVVDLPPDDDEPPRGSAGGRRGKQTSTVRPIAIEPTEDGVAGVATVFVRLPGGDDAPVQLALASALILMSRVYPLNSRAFLRRRNSHHAST